MGAIAGLGEDMRESMLTMWGTMKEIRDDQRAGLDAAARRAVSGVPAVGSAVGSVSGASVGSARAGRSGLPPAPVGPVPVDFGDEGTDADDRSFAGLSSLGSPAPEQGEDAGEE